MIKMCQNIIKQFCCTIFLPNNWILFMILLSSTFSSIPIIRHLLSSIVICWLIPPAPLCDDIISEWTIMGINFGTRSYLYLAEFYEYKLFDQFLVHWNNSVFTCVWPYLSYRWGKYGIFSSFNVRLYLC